MNEPLNPVVAWLLSQLREITPEQLVRLVDSATPGVDLDDAAWVAVVNSAAPFLRDLKAAIDTLPRGE